MLIQSFFEYTNKQKLYNFQKRYKSQMKSQQSHQNSPSSIQLSQKQYYLREQIIQSNYPPQQFVQYLNKILGIDSDLDRCTIQQLEQVVKKFKLSKEKQNLQANLYFKSNTANNQTICQKISVITQPSKIRVKTNPEIYQQEYRNQIKCVKIVDKYQHLKNNITCEVKNPQRKYFGGLFGITSRSYLCFEVWSHGLNKQLVYRRYSDFIWLRQVLLKFYPSTIIPPIPNKKSYKRLPRQILKRMRMLSYFLNDIVRIPIFLNNKYVQGFFTINDEKQFMKLKSEGQNKKSYECIQSTQTISGKVQLQLTDQTIKYKDGLKVFIPQLETLYKQITRNSKKIRIITLQKINILYSMANQFGDLFKKSSMFNTFIKTQSMQKLTQIYAVLNNMMAQWGNSLKKQTQQIQKNMSTFFKYVRQQLMGFKQLITKTQNIQLHWLTQKQALDKYKQKIFQLNNQNKWELPKRDLQNFPKSAIYNKTQAFKIMLPKQSLQVQSLKQNYAYYLSQMYKNGNCTFQRCINKFIDNFKQFSIKMKVNNQQIGALWSEVSTKFSDPFKKPSNIQNMEMENILQQNQNQSSNTGADDD